MTTLNINSPVHRTRLRLIVMAVIGLATALLVGFLGSWPYAPTMGWAAASLTYLIWVWPTIGSMDSTQTASYATREDPGSAISDVLVLAATIGSFGGVALILLDAASAQGGGRAAIVALALGSVALSWFLVHTLYTLRYAAIYYTGPDGGVSFNESEPPRYVDFAYLSFTVGMTFQVSDTDLKTGAIRSTVLRHALLSYLLGAIVLATTINLVSGLSK
ncbi:DUF1345 domain-containing protein [Paenarthrobacter sp. Z7-10]|uniref:DUF1345 domain-containing protein n=1 Tax=Paenarthrobacter sp. Z7-10 TaxID=2787635 RepID=UPI0022A938AD|nr:DUF1345 domain-containing protein [Paenarthrobacter sp. Z7-10]MCZ2403971.1 DUF1345 domain-containing protein [Paenarthrobacter sp. Z7-10]